MPIDTSLTYNISMPYMVSVPGNIAWVNAWLENH